MSSTSTPTGLGGVLGYVEIVLCGLEIPAVTQIPGQHLGDRRKRVGVVDLTRRLFDVGDGGDLAMSSGWTRTNGIKPECRSSPDFAPRDFRDDAWAAPAARCYSDDVASTQRRFALLLLRCRSEAH